MQELKKKRGSHYFSHIENNGEKRHVYLGSDKKKALERLAFLRAERIQSQKKHMKKIDALNSKLSQLAEFHRPHDDILNDIRKRYYKRKHAEQLLDTERPKKLPLPQHHFFQTFIVILVVALALFSITLFSPELAVTGHAVTNYVDEGKYSDFSTTKQSWADAWESIKGPHSSPIMIYLLMMICSAGVLAAFFGRVEYNNKTKDDEYKHPLMRHDQNN